MNKRGQFFLLAAVIISVVVLSLGITTNQAISRDEPSNFYDFSYEVTREIGSVIDYEIYSGFDDSADLDEFVELLSDDIKERSSDSEFIFIYGNEDGVKLKSYGNNKISIGGETVSDENKSNDVICFKGSCQKISNDLGSFVDGSYILSNQSSNGDLLVELSGNEFNFPISEKKQVLFIMQKNVDGDKYVSVG